MTIDSVLQTISAVTSFSVLSAFFFHIAAVFSVFFIFLFVAAVSFLAVTVFSVFFIFTAFSFSSLLLLLLHRMLQFVHMISEL